MRRNFAQILKDAKIDIKVEYQKLYGMLYDRSIQVSNTNRISVYDELSTFFIAFHEQLEYWYDEVYQMCLLAFMRLEHIDRKKKFDSLKSQIEGT